MKEILNAVYELEQDIQDIMAATQFQKESLYQQYEQNLHSYEQEEETALKQSYYRALDSLNAEFKQKQDQLKAQFEKDLAEANAQFEEEKSSLVQAIVDNICSSL